MPVKFVAVNLTPAARDALRHAAVIVSAELGERVSMSDALLIIKTVADQHRDQFRAIADQTMTTSQEGSDDDDQ